MLASEGDEITTGTEEIADYKTARIDGYPTVFGKAGQRLREAAIRG